MTLIHFHFCVTVFICTTLRAAYSFMQGLFVPIVIIGLTVHVSVFIVVTVTVELKGYLLACLLVYHDMIQSTYTVYTPHLSTVTGDLPAASQDFSFPALPSGPNSLTFRTSYCGPSSTCVI